MKFEKEYLYWRTSRGVFFILQAIKKESPPQSQLKSYPDTNTIFVYVYQIYKDMLYIIISAETGLRFAKKMSSPSEASAGVGVGVSVKNTNISLLI